MTGSAPSVLELAALGRRIRLVAADEGLLAAAVARLPAGWSRPAGRSRPSEDDEAPLEVELLRDRARGIVRLRVEGELVGAARDDEALLERSEQVLTMAVASRARSGIVLHAAMVSYRGRALLLPGRSRVGKSTLTAALIGTGARYEADDLVLLDDRGGAVGIAGPLSLRRTGGRARVSASALGWHRPRPALSLDRIVVLRFCRGGRLALRRLSPATAVLELFRHAVGARHAPERALTTLTGICRGTPVEVGRRGEATEAATALVAALSREGPV